MANINYETGFMLQPGPGDEASPTTPAINIEVKSEDEAHILGGLRRDSNIIIFDGFAYSISSDSNDKIRYLQCASSGQIGCPSRATMNMNDRTGTVHIIRPHSHGPDPHLVQRSTFIQELKRRVVNQAGTVRAVYDQTCLDFPNAAALVPFPSIEQTMRQARATTLPPRPADLLDMGAYLSKPAWRRLSQTVNGGLFYAATIDGGDGSVALVFSNPEFLEKVKTTKELHIDASFVLKPDISGGRYLFSVHAIMHRHSSAVYFGLMSHKTNALYRAILLHLRQMVKLAPTTVICDFERDLYHAVHESFPESVLQGSYYHYLTHVYHKLAVNCVTNPTHMDDQIQLMIYQIMALPLLPSGMIANGLNIIDETGHNCLALGAYKRVMEYLDEVWWNGVSPGMLTFFNKYECTSNNINMFHKTIRDRFVGITNPWILVEKLKEVECLMFRDFQLLEGGHGIGRERKTKLLSSNDKVLRAWRMIDNGRLPPTLFFERVVEPLALIESELRYFILDYEEVKLIKGEDFLGDDFKVLDRRLVENGCEDVIGHSRKRKYGVSNLPSVSKKIQTDPIVESKICISCQDGDWEARCELRPCGHKPFCTVCAARAVTDQNKCPKCGKEPSSFVELDVIIVD